jgi:hypothetical protein
VQLDKSIKGLVGLSVFCNLRRSPFIRTVKGNTMLRFAGSVRLALLALLLPLSAQAAPGLSISLKNYYTDYEIVVDCSGKSRLTPAEAEAAKSAIGKIEAYYIKRDPSIDKQSLLKQAVSNKNAALKMVKAQNQVEAARFCKASLNDLVGKMRDIDSAPLADKGGSS